MTKEKKLLLIPITTVAAILIYCWTIILTTEIGATWRHYIGLALFVVIITLLFRNLAAATLVTGIYLILATFNLLAMTPTIYTSGIRIGPISTPDIQLLSLGLFILYFWINFNPLADMYLDYKEDKDNKVRNKMK